MGEYCSLQSIPGNSNDNDHVGHIGGGNNIS